MRKGVVYWVLPQIVVHSLWLVNFLFYFFNFFIFFGGGGGKIIWKMKIMQQILTKITKVHAHPPPPQKKKIGQIWEG